MYNTYESPFGTRYASEEMQYLFSADKKFKTWRLLWIALAKAERKLGLPITEEQIAELEAHKDDINYDVAEERERLRGCRAHEHGHGSTAAARDACIALELLEPRCEQLLQLAAVCGCLRRVAVAERRLCAARIEAPQAEVHRRTQRL